MKAATANISDMSRECLARQSDQTAAAAIASVAAGRGFGYPSLMSVDIPRIRSGIVHAVHMPRSLTA